MPMPEKPAPMMRTSVCPERVVIRVLRGHEEPVSHALV